MHAGMLALCAGLLLLRFLPRLPGTAELWALALLAALLCGWRPVRLVSLLLGGLLWACLSAQSVLDDRLATGLDGRTLWLQGRIVGLPEVEAGVARFYLEQAQSRRAELPQRLRLSWYGAPRLQGGETWRLAVSLRRPRGSVNPHAFDYEAWLTARQVGATGSVKSGERLAAGTGPRAWRDALRQRLLAVPAHGREGALAALVLGDGSGLGEADWQMLQATGTVHLLVISGQHVALLAGLLYGLVALLYRIGLWPRDWPWLPAACLLALAGALGYGALAGFEVPVRRACLMLAVVLLWRWRFRHLGAWFALLVALTLVLLADPLASLQPGFWLSFGAVALLIWCFAAREGRLRALPVLLVTQWAMTLGLLPLLIGLGLPVSLSGPLANLLAVPWVGFGIVPLALFGTLLLPLPWVGEALLWLAGWQLDRLFDLLGALASRWPAWTGAALPGWRILLALLGALLILLPRGIPVRLPAALLLVAALFPAPPRLPAGQAEVWLLDVGQGLAVLVRTREHALLYDAGPRRHGFDSGEKVVAPALRGLGVTRLDTLLLSHADSDHAGGTAAVLRALSVDTLHSGEPERHRLTRTPGPCVDGAEWRWDGVRFVTWQWAGAGDGNERSCLLHIEAGGERLLLTGDIGLRGERWLLQAGRAVQADWLLAPHHGSRTSSGEAFLRAVAPRGVLVSRGWRNAFGHPHAEVLARYAALGIAVHDTARDGALRLLLGSGTGPQGLRGSGGFWQEK